MGLFAAALSRRRFLSGGTVAVAAATLVGFAMVTPGYPTSNVQLNDGGVWVTNGNDLMVGRLNRQIDQLDAAVTSAANDTDVVQEGARVFSVQPSTGTLQPLDVAYVRLGSDVHVPTGAQVGLGGGVLTVLDPTAGAAWIRSADGVSGLDTKTQKPNLSLGPGGSVAVGPTGVVAGLSVTDDTLTVVEPSGGRRVVKLGRDVKSASVTVVGDKAVVLDAARSQLITDDGASHDLGKSTNAVLQQPGEANAGVLVATDKALLDVPLSGGSPRQVAPGAGGPIAPVRLGGCAHAAWTATPTYVEDCPGSKQLQVKIPHGTAGAALRFRVNRSVIVLNDVQTGNVWLLDRAITLMAANWADVQPKDPTKQSKQQDNTSQDTQTLKRTPQNHPPVAKPDQYGARPGLPTLLPVLENDTDPDNDVLVIDKVAAPAASAGKVSIVGDGQQLQFTAAPGATGTVTFQYTVDDGRGGTSSATVRVDIHPFSENSPPRQVRPTTTVAIQGGTVTHQVLGDWIDPDGDQLSLAGASVTTADTVRFTSSGSVTFVDAGTAPGLKNVTLHVTDGKASTSGTLAVTVRPPGQLPPTARADHVITFVGTTVTVAPLLNDTDPNQDPLRLSAVDAPAGVTVVPDYTTGTFTLAAAQAGTYYIVYTAVDGPNSAQALVRVDVLRGGTNSPPIAVRDLAFVPPAGSTTVDVLANDIDVDGDVLVVTGVSVAQGSGLSVSVRDHRFLTIAASGLLAAPVTVTYTVSDGTASAQGGVIVRSALPTAHNQPPVTAPDTATVRAGDVLSLDVLANDSDPEGAPLHLAPKLAEPASAGTLSVIGDRLHFQAPDQPGTVRAIYVATDSVGQTASSLVTIYVRPRDGHNSPPTPRALTARALAGTTTRIDIPLDGIDSDGDSVHLVGLGTAPTKGRIVDVGTDHLQYQAYDQTGTDTFSYVVEDRLGARGTAILKVGIAARPLGNQPPVAQDDTVTTRPGRTVSVDVRANDSDPDGDPITFAAHPFTGADASKATLSGGRVQVRAPASGALTITYTITDGRGGTASGHLTVNANSAAPLQPPIAVDDVVSTDQLTPGQFVPIDVLANDSDPDGSAQGLKVSIHLPASVARVDKAGRVLVKGTAAAQTLPYTVTDVDGLTATASVLVPAAANLPPRLKPGASPVTVGSTGATWSLASLVADPEGHRVLMVGANPTATNSDGGRLAMDNTTLHFVPAANYSGPASLTFEVTDGSGLNDPKGRTALLTLDITVRGSGNQPPVFAGASLAAAVGEGPASLDLAPLAKDPNGDKPTFKLPATPPPGFDVQLNGTMLSVSAKAGAKAGTVARLSMTVTDGKSAPQPAPVDLRVAASSRPLAQAVADSSVADQGKSIKVDVTANDANPFPDTPLKVTSARVVGGTANTSVDGNQVSVTPGGGFVGTVTVQYTIRDKTGDAARDVTGLLTVTVRGVPGRPVAPTVLETRDSTVVLSWPSPPSNGASIDGYKVSAAGVSKSCPTTTCTISGLTNGTAYRFTVTAHNAVGDSPASPTSAAATPDNKPDPPAAPTTTFGDASLKVAWVPPHNTGTPISHYEVEISPGGAAQPVTGTSYTFTGLANGQSYQVRVRAFNGAPSPSDWSAYSAPETPAGVPSQPAPPTAAVAGGDLGGQVTVNWTQPATNGARIDTYALQELRNGTVVTTHTYPGGTTTATLAADNANQYSYVVSATNKAGKSPDSPPSSPVTPFGHPATIGSVSATPGNGQATLSFSPPNNGGQDITTYKVQWSGGLASFGGDNTTNSLVVPGLANKSSYSFQVQACNTYCGQWSPSSNAVTPYGPPTAPSSVSSSPNYKQVSFSWAAASDDGSPINHYEISFNGGGWQNVGMATSTGLMGDAYNASYPFQVRAVDSAGEAGPANGTSGSTGAASIDVGEAGNADGRKGCSGSACKYITVTIHGFAPNDYSFTPDSSEGNSGFYPYVVHSDGSYGYKQSGDYFGTRGGWVSVTIDGVRGQTTW